MNLLNPAALYQELSQAKENKQALALATVIATKGSTPQRAGAKMLIYRDGKLSGTVGGGCVEADVVGAAQRLMRQKKAELCCFELIADPGDPDGDVCGGIMEIFIEPYLPE
ncbi:MAG: XdhC family protein [Acidobacteria bacterium]|nr:XdhC family protein [Acidobacteriota bacterium]